jgi:hypothetical protein
MAGAVTPPHTLPDDIRGERVRLVAEAGGAGATYGIVRLRDGARVGALRLAAAGSTLVIEALCIDGRERGYGCGSDAAWALAGAAEVAGFQRLRAWAPGELGLAVYFWIRHGFRPLFGPGPDEGIWFERMLAPPERT